MTDVVHAGDLAEYCGTVKALAGRRCEVVEVLLARVRVAFRNYDGAMITCNVKAANLKRLGGGGVIDND